MARTKETVETLPPGRYPPQQSRQLTELAIDPDAQEITLRFDRVNWPEDPNEVLQVMIEVSIDDGASWPYQWGMGCRGGIHTKRDGTVATESTVTFPVPRSRQPRRVRSSVSFQIQLDTRVQIDIVSDPEATVRDVHAGS